MWRNYGQDYAFCGLHAPFQTTRRNPNINDLGANYPYVKGNSFLRLYLKGK